MKTSGNTVFISGGSAGIGLEIAKLFDRNNNTVIINGRNKERLEAALAQLQNGAAIQGDLSVESERNRIAEEILRNYPGTNILINNAAAAFSYKLGTTAGAWDFARQEMNTNYISIIHFTELLLPSLLAKDAAAIVNITSIAALRPSASIPTYSASKAALRSYTLSLRDVLREHAGIQVYEVLPPLVNTGFSAGIGGANGIPPAEVAEELVAAMELNQPEVPVGMTKQLFQKV